MCITPLSFFFSRLLRVFLLLTASSSVSPLLTQLELHGMLHHERKRDIFCFVFPVEKSEIWRKKLWGRWLNSQAAPNNNKKDKKTLLCVMTCRSQHRDIFFFELWSSFVVSFVGRCRDTTFYTCRSFYSSLTCFTSFASIQFDFQRVHLRPIYI